MLLPHYLYVTIIMAISIALAGFIVYLLMKAIPRTGSNVAGGMRGCAGFFIFMLVLTVVVFGLTLYVPSSTIIIAGPEKEYSRKTALLTAPTELMEKYGFTDFEFDGNYIINTTDRNMMIYKATYDIVPSFSEADSPVIEVPAKKCTKIKPAYLPDFFFEEPGSIRVKSSEKKRQERWVLDYTPINP